MRSAARNRLWLAWLVVGSLALATPALGVRSPATPADEALRAEIESGLAAIPEREGLEVRVVVREGVVVLQGRARLLEQSLAAERAAWRTPGVMDVDNEIRVSSPRPGGDPAIEQDVRLIVKGDARFHDTNLRLQVSSGVVSVSGLFQDPRDVLDLKHRIASVPGVVDVVIQAQLLAAAPRPPAASPPTGA